MEPKEKAIQLVDRYIQENGNSFFAKQCALIAVDEILDVISAIYDYDFKVLNPYWLEVKKEIELL